MARFIHQAIVRRDDAVELITNAHRRGHRAYRNLDLDKVREKARRCLPEHGVPAEITKLLPFDSLLD